LFNGNFKHKLYRIKINQIQLKETVSYAIFLFNDRVQMTVVPYNPY
jgi:hypothetical protein